MPPKIYNAKNAKRAKKDKKANLLQGANAQSATTKAYSTTMGWAKKGGRRWSPPRGVTINSNIQNKLEHSKETRKIKVNSNIQGKLENSR